MNLLSWWCATALPLAVFAKLKYISDRKIEALALGDGSNSGEQNFVDQAHLILVKTQSCGDLCDIYEKSLDGMAEDIGESVASALGRNVTFYKTEVASNGVKAFQKKFGLVRLPTTMLIRGPWVYDYTENLTTTKLQTFISNHLSDVLETFSTSAAADKWIAGDGDLAPGEVRILVETGEAGRQNFELVAGGEREFAKYGYLRKGGETNTRGRLRVKKWTSELELTDVDFADHKKIYELLLDNQLPSLGTIEMSVMRYYFMSQRSFAWIVHGGDTASWVKAAGAIKEVVRRFGDKFHFLRVDAKQAPHYADFAKEVLHLQWSEETDRSSEQRPHALVITDLNGAGRFTYEPEKYGGWEAKGVTKWFEAAIADEIPRELQSEFVPKNNTERMTSVGMLKLVADEMPRVLPAAKNHHLVIVPSMLCSETVCEPALQAMRTLHNQQVDQEAPEALIVDCGKVEVRIIDGVRNEFDPKWDFDLALAPPVWFIRKNQQVSNVSDLNKISVPQSAFESVDTLKSWLSDQCTVKHADQRLDEL